ncbi:hypothetical protein [Tritonibacter sp. SIMBA_163]|uniref:hypothetical protein n=1 Tax=Tritonibacter sp. SIMBA_163 TaxID=3080868 RepID=UPI003980E572
MIAYIVGFVVLSLSPFEDLTMVYGLGGTAWLLIWFFGSFLRDAEWVVDHNTGQSLTTDEATKPEPFGRDYGTLSANDATVIYNAGHN